MKVKDLKDKYKDKMCILYGAGPSLHFIDTSILKSFVSIVVNSAIIKVKLADFFIADDIAIKNWDYYISLLPKLDCINLLYEDKLKSYAGHLDITKIIWFKHKWWFSSLNKKYNLEGLRLTKNEPIIGARTSCGSAVHFAYILGCNPIVLIGVDCCWRDNKRYFWQYKNEEKTHRINGDKSIGRPLVKKYKDKKIDRHSLSYVEYWNYFAKINKDILENEMKIIDCSDSILECFPKMTIEEVLVEYGKKVR